MEIQLSSHTERPAVSSPAPDTESSQSSVQKLKPEKGKLGVFAKLLAGLSSRGPSGRDEAGQGLAKKAANAADTDQSGASEAALIAGARGKTVEKKLSAAGAMIGGGNEKAGAKKTVKNGDFEPELSHIQNLVQTAASQSGQAEKVPSGYFSETETVPGNLSDGTGVTETDGQTLTSAATVFSASVDTVSADTAIKKSANAAVIAGAETKSGENLKNVNGKDEKVKNRAVHDEAISEKTDIAAFSPKTEVKKAAADEKEVPTKLEEARNREKKRSISVNVHDFRSSGTQVEAALKENSVQIRSGGESSLSGDVNGNDIMLELRLSNQGQDSSNAVTSWETKSGQAFEDLLARELHQNFNNDIVRHASLALRDHNEGTIRLALKPESLGNVKIHLEMAENKITGRIVVESEEALRAFEREIASLEKAFRDSGFEGANLEMSLAADGRGADQRQQETEASQFLSGRIAASRYDASVERIETPLTFDVYRQGITAINVLA